MAFLFDRSKTYHSMLSYLALYETLCSKLNLHYCF